MIKLISKKSLGEKKRKGIQKINWLMHPVKLIYINNTVFEKHVLSENTFWYCIVSDESLLKSLNKLNLFKKKSGEHSCQSVISIKLLCNFIEITLRDGCSPVNLMHIFRTHFPKNTCGRQLLYICYHTSLWIML